MDYIDLKQPDVRQSLEFDEALLDECGRLGGEFLSVWEPKYACVVAGYSNRTFRDVRLDTCRRLGIPVHRRKSGGGTVLVGPGCLNYSLVLNTDMCQRLSQIRSTNRYVMGRLRRAISRLSGGDIQVAGFTDLTLGDRKFGGNAQLRRRKGILFHGTLMLSMDIELVEATLVMPRRTPEYRRGRSHHEFLTNLQESAEDVKRAIRDEWKALPLVDEESEALFVRCGWTKSEAMGTH